ncbi:MAG: hypothetical protein LJF04_02195 [Gemmatimonadetes bacterium]|nr:hypothetical protein [Gemmatimonadota bacterium]
MGLEFLVPVFGILLFLVPITGLTVVFTAKYALKPLVEALTQIRLGQGTMQPSELEARLRDVTEQVEVLSDEIRRLRDAQDFDRQLKAPATSGEAKDLVGS